jgi:hypothetical protein
MMMMIHSSIPNFFFSLFFLFLIFPYSLDLTILSPPFQKCYAFMMELVNMFPTLEFYPRGTYSLKDIIGYANNRGFSNVVVLNESNKKINGLWMVHLPEGPTAKFKVSGIVLSKEIPNAGRAGGSVPEVILNNFATRSVIFFFFFFFFFFFSACSNFESNTKLKKNPDPSKFTSTTLSPGLVIPSDASLRVSSRPHPSSAADGSSRSTTRYVEKTHFL